MNLLTITRVQNATAEGKRGYLYITDKYEKRKKLHFQANRTRTNLIKRQGQKFRNKQSQPN